MTAATIAVLALSFGMPAATVAGSLALASWGAR
jgi:hypothetical protein